jgi:hypothetical protein
MERLHGFATLQTNPIFGITMKKFGVTTPGAPSKGDHYTLP